MHVPFFAIAALQLTLAAVTYRSISGTQFATDNSYDSAGVDDERNNGDIEGKEKGK